MKYDFGNGSFRLRFEVMEKNIEPQFIITGRKHIAVKS